MLELAKNNIKVLNANGDIVSRFLSTYKSDSTKRDYKRYVLEFFGKTKTEEISDVMLKPIRVIHAQEYLLECLNRTPKLSDSAIKARKDALSAFWGYVIDTFEGEIIATNPWKNTTIKNLLKNNFEKKTDLFDHRVLTREEINNLLAYAQSYKGTNAKRNYLLLKVLLNCGLRRGECGKFLWSDFVSKNDKWYLRIEADIAKGRKERFVFVNDNLFAELAEFGGDEYIITATEKPLFGLCGDSINRIVKRYCGAIGIKEGEITAHTLRHTNITYIAETGVKLEKLQYHAGHASSDTTMKYITLVNKFKDSAGEACQW